MPTDTELKQLNVYVGTQAKVNEARQQGLIGENDFVIVTDAPDFQEVLTAGVGIDITNNVIRNTGLLSATYDSTKDELVIQ